MIQASKELIIVLVNAIHLILHIAGQTAIFIKNIAIILRSAANVVYVLIVSGNAILHSIIEFPSNAYTWLITPPPSYGYAIVILAILLLSIGITLARMIRAPRSCTNAHHSDTEEQERLPESSLS